MEAPRPLISVVLPIYNEEANIQELYARLTSVMEKLCADVHGSAESFEIIMIDDGSKDMSWHMIKDLHEKDKRIKGLSFSRNFGHHIAISAGLDFADGDAVVLMDGDLQDPPEEIPKLYQKFREGFDVVYAIREKRPDSVFKKLTSWIFLRLLKKIANVDINLESGIFRIISKRTVAGMREIKERNRFITGLMSWIGYSKIGVPTERHARKAGKSQYTFYKLYKLALHGITSFSYFPLQLGTYLGVAAAFSSFLYGFYLLIKKLLFGIPLLGYTSLMVSIYFLGGIILMVLGVIGEYIGRIYEEVQGRPLYLIKDRVF